MPLTGYLKIDDIPGESKRADHEGEIDVHDIHWNISQGSSSARGSGRTQSRAQVSSLTCYKEVDASSPYLALACMQGKSIPEATLALRKDSGDAHLDYLTIKMTNCIVTTYEMLNDDADQSEDSDSDVVTERLALSFESVNMVYTVQADDHSAGDEHEIEFDIVAGV
ncbi:type VI secretion system tube protein Hcp [Yoonia sp. F2084L]|uniref:Hcp family type VI secretion system effector n=1 Tax=Yoonia sp. F2084L TaxID=2926419 RepID=UPI001FF50CC3|nr:type VI secretion system tube protein Hcp [Yoonia sp. F2084L]MCK0094143.1 type VI secretion system tube protein Hcp [Yoonia sp. F2084L]